MEPTMHLQQGLTLLQKVLKFYPIMRQGDKAEVELTQQDWLVLMDFVENPSGSGLAPESVKEMAVDRGAGVISITTQDCNVEVTYS